MPCDRQTSLERFRRYAIASSDMERLKREFPPGRSPLADRLMRGCEELLDGAFDDIGEVAENVSDVTALMLSMHYMDGLTWEDVGEMFGITGNAAKQRCHRALRRLDSRRNGK